MHTEQLFNNVCIHTINTEYALMLVPQIHIAVKMSQTKRKNYIIKHNTSVMTQS